MGLQFFSSIADETFRVTEKTIQSENGKFKWVDIVDPSKAELEAIAERYGLHSTSVQDCLDPGHLPKLERFGVTTFLILRAFDEGCSTEGDTIEELTRKVAVFSGENFLITVHRQDQPFISKLREKWQNYPETIQPQDRLHILGDILKGVVSSYQAPIERAEAKLEEIETRIFRGDTAPRMIEDGYYLRREASVFKRMLRLTSDVTSKFNGISEAAAPFFQDIRELLDRLYLLSDELQESIDQLLSLHISLSSQRTNEASQRINEASHRTNEVVRVLTLFSVFFLPLNFIASIYGMNFEHMPELKWAFGYPGVLIVMLSIALGIFFWFQKNGWLKRDSDHVE